MTGNLFSINRRTALKAAGVTLFAPFINRTANAAGELVVCSFGGNFQAAQRKVFFAPFSKETGINVVETSAPDIARLQAMHDAKDMQWDIMCGSGRWYPTLVKKNLLERIDQRRFHLTDIDKQAVQSHAISYIVTTQALCYSPTKVPGGVAPKGWADFWNVERYPGARTLSADVTFKLEFALLADGVAPKDLYPVDIDRAFAKLSKIRPHIKLFTTFADQPAQLVSRGEVVFGEAPSNTIRQAQSQGFDVDLTWDQAGYQYSYMFITNGAKHRDEAYAFVDFCGRADRQAEFSTLTGYGPTNRKAIDLIPEDVRKSICNYPANIEKQWALDGTWIADNFDALTSRYQRFMLG